ncbi:hypothetical protein C2S53_003047 [Perilla frutescens var. hirtella]|uniref:Chromo domain-containing protein n=1 Tax=Perilla frutescens var. hirtella TaxID=608512 RepID=A0AAD4JNS6_PERFH|nr:hypothetical protein C2S53_003047 [Perilla frutescens var. hirtella]
MSKLKKRARTTEPKPSGSDAFSADRKRAKLHQIQEHPVLPVVSDKILKEALLQQEEIQREEDNQNPNKNHGIEEDDDEDDSQGFSETQRQVWGAGLPTLLPLVIVSSRIVLRSGRPDHQILVQWQGLPPDAATWESLASFREAFPDFHLEDKVELKAGGVDTSESSHDVGIAQGRPRRETRRPSRYV